MTQYLITLSVNDDLIVAVANAIGEVETRFEGLASLSIDERRAASKMGPKSETFCRQTLNALSLHPNVVPSGVGVEKAQANFDTLDRLRPLFQRLHRLSQRCADTEVALGNDIMDSALQGYRVLKAVGRNHGLDGLRRELGGRRFKAVRPATPEEPAATA
jgi:hypothetical protein